MIFINFLNSPLQQLFDVGDYRDEDLKL